MERLGGSVGRVSDFGSGHDLKAYEFEPRIELAVSAEPPSDLLPTPPPALPLLWPFPTCACLSLSKINKYLKQNKMSQRP